MVSLLISNLFNKTLEPFAPGQVINVQQLLTSMDTLVEYDLKSMPKNEHAH